MNEVILNAVRKMGRKVDKMGAVIEPFTCSEPIAAGEPALMFNGKLSKPKPAGNYYQYLTSQSGIDQSSLAGCALDDGRVLAFAQVSAGGYYGMAAFVVYGIDGGAPGHGAVNTLESNNNSLSYFNLMAKSIGNGRVLLIAQNGGNVYGWVVQVSGYTITKLVGNVLLGSSKTPISVEYLGGNVAALVCGVADGHPVLFRVDIATDGKTLTPGTQITLSDHGLLGPSFASANACILGSNIFGLVSFSGASAKASITVFSWAATGNFVVEKAATAITYSGNAISAIGAAVGMGNGVVLAVYRWSQTTMYAFAIKYDQMAKTITTSPSLETATNDAGFTHMLYPNNNLYRLSNTKAIMVFPSSASTYRYMRKTFLYVDPASLVIISAGTSISVGTTVSTDYKVIAVVALSESRGNFAYYYPNYYCASTFDEPDGQWILGGVSGFALESGNAGDVIDFQLDGNVILPRNDLLPGVIYKQGTWHPGSYNSGQVVGTALSSSKLRLQRPIWER